MSKRGQLLWCSCRVFDEPWKISNAAPGVNSIVMELEWSGPTEITASVGNVVNTSSSGGIMTGPVPLIGGYLPHWSNVTIGRIAIPGGFPDCPAEQIKQMQIPYWPALTLTLAFTAWSGKSVFNHL